MFATPFLGSRRRTDNLVEFEEEQHSATTTAATPESAVLHNADAATVRRAIEELPPEFREALILREMEELSYRQIAEITSVPVGTVMSRLSRARSLLRQRLAGQQTGKGA
jgi:RNA polymerase sigma factor (sigma-70 family)